MNRVAKQAISAFETPLNEAEEARLDALVKELLA